MNNKKILFLIGGVAIIVILSVVAKYQITQNGERPSSLQEPVADGVEAPEESKVYFTATEYQGVLESVTEEKLVISKPDGSQEEYTPEDIHIIFDGRVRDAMKMIGYGDLQAWMHVQVSTGTNQQDNSQTNALTVY